MSSRAREKEERRRERQAAEQAAQARSRRKRLQLAGGAVLAALVLVAGLVALASSGGDTDSESSTAASAPAAPELSAAALRSLPKPLAANAKQANQIIDGSTEALEAKLKDLRGHPVVVNQWGSWCPPCRAEFPLFADSATSHLRDVAFVGVDIQDDRGAAEDFLAELPVPYPSIFDQDTAAVQSLDWRGVSPTTWFIDKKGEVVHQRPGAYPNRGALEADIQMFLLGA